VVEILVALLHLPGRVDLGSNAIFEGPNDLVVDTASMTQLGAMSIPESHRLDLSDERTVHHCSYFRNRRTITFLTDVLQV
jgi:hypothetical protein